MRFLLFGILCMFYLCSSAQVPDTLRKGKSKTLSLSKFPKKEDPPEKKAYVVITSDKRSHEGKDPWENEWTDYIETQSYVIAGKVLTRDGDSVKIDYKVVIDFLVNEDGLIKDLQVTCTPSHSFIVNECIKMAMNAPKRKSAFKSGKYVKMHIKQPVDIKVK
jgi:hypothetical protein